MKAEWDYRVETLGGSLRGTRPEELELLLNEAAAEGWEMMDAFCPSSNSNRLFVVLRRELGIRKRKRSRGWP